MTRSVTLSHQFVERIPDELDDGTVYVSIPFATAAHKCCCGCGNEVITPLTPTDWALLFDGETISLDPSIGSWSLECRSHYWIKRNKVKWSNDWSQTEVEAGRARDALATESYYDTIASSTHDHSAKAPEKLRGGKPRKSFWKKLISWFR